MMNNTLLSIIAMAIVTNSTVYAAHSVQKDILVEAEIAEPLILTRGDGSPFNSLQLEYKPEKWSAVGDHLMFSPATLTVKQPIKITAHQGARIKLSLAENFYMSDIKGELLSPDVFIDENMLQQDVGHEFTPDKGGQELQIEAEVPEDAKPGDKYTGVLKLVMESVP